MGDDTYYIWITFLTAASLDVLLLGLIHEGLLVKPLDHEEGNFIASPDVLGKQVALEVAFSVEPEENTADALIDELQVCLENVLTKHKMNHLGYVLVDSQNDVLRWTSGNILNTGPASTAQPTAWNRLNQGKGS